MTYDDATRRLARLLQARAGEAITSTAASVRQEAQRGVDAAIATAEPALGNPASDGYVLSSSAAGVRAWVPQDAAAAWADITGKPSVFPPEAHAATHAAAGSDPLAPAAIGALATTDRSNATPQPLGTAAAGTGTSVSRDDHRHAMPTAAQVGASPAGPAFSVNKGGTNQIGIVPSTFTLVTWSVEVFDTQNAFAANTFTPLAAGVYVLSACITWLTGVGDQTRIIVSIWKNGLEQFRTEGAASGNALQASSIVGVVNAVAGDSFDIRCWHNATGNLGLSGDYRYSHFHGARVA